MSQGGLFSHGAISIPECACLNQRSGPPTVTVTHKTNYIDWNHCDLVPISLPSKVYITDAIASQRRSMFCPVIPAMLIRPEPTM